MLAAPPQYPSNRSTSMGLGGDGHWNFNKNIIIILAILLYALICMLGLYSLIRFTGEFRGSCLRLRRQRWRSWRRRD
ncbi:hypothetical protein KFK09_025376 [Dendrobium nobile]|uniref:Uncharacterized protein n=1 Tax=Dendrobium nobile TaxID=94219 RepID=A0A8T3AF84_DENNO|nr:hypothetical protein KFK09_025376 [Dendrobium nobile]